jgi:hypothetical protein
MRTEHSADQSVRLSCASFQEFHLLSQTKTASVVSLVLARDERSSCCTNLTAPEKFGLAGSDGVELSSENVAEQHTPLRARLCSSTIAFIVQQLILP